MAHNLGNLGTSRTHIRNSGKPGDPENEKSFLFDQILGISARRPVSRTPPIALHPLGRPGPFLSLFISICPTRPHPPQRSVRRFPARLAGPLAAVLGQQPPAFLVLVDAAAALTTTHRRRPATTSEATKARIRATPRSDSRQRGTGTAGSISTSGWVTKIRAMARR